MFWAKLNALFIKDNKLENQFSKILEFLNTKNTDSQLNIKLAYTFIIIYYFREIENSFLSDFMLILSKGEKFIINNGYQYSDLIDKIK